MMTLRGLFACLLLFSSTLYASPIHVTDIAGRSVTLPHPAEHVILADARALLAISILFPDDPTRPLAAWDNSLQAKSPDMMAAFSAKYPALKKVPVFDNPYTSDFSVEKAVMLHPDLVIFDIGLLPKLTSTGVLTQLEAAGIPAVIIDFRQQPLRNTVPSMQLLGKVFGQSQHAQAFTDFYQKRMALIHQRISTLPAGSWPSVFIERAAGMDPDQCCDTFGKGSFGEFIAAAGGKNIGSDLFKGLGGTLNIEQVITANPDYYLLTGADWSHGHQSSMAVPLGYTTTEAISQQKLAALMNRTGINVLSAVREKKVMAMYHQFYDSPLNVIAVEALAKFFHPALFGDLDPKADLEWVHQTFTAFDDSGVFWITPQ